MMALDLVFTGWQAWEAPSSVPDYWYKAGLCPSSLEASKAELCLLKLEMGDQREGGQQHFELWLA